MGARQFSTTATDRVVVSDHADLDATTAITVDCWAYWDNVETDNVKHLVSKFNAYTLRISRKGSFPGFLFTIVDGGTERIAVGGTPVAGRWYHMAGTYDGTTVKMRVYDSVADTMTNYTLSYTGDIDTSANDLHIGTFETFNTAFDFQGRISGVRIWKNRALSDVEIDAYRRIVSPPLAGTDAPVLDLPLGLDSPEPDWSGNGHSGTVTGATIATGPPVIPYSVRFARATVPVIETATGPSFSIPAAVANQRRRRIA